MFLNCADITSSVFHMHTYQTHAPLMGESGLCVCVWNVCGRRGDAWSCCSRVLLLCALSVWLSVKSMCPCPLSPHCFLPLPCSPGVMIRIRCCCVELGSPALLPPTLLVSHWPLWLTGISLVQYVCQWGLRLSCAPAYPWCVSLSRSHTHTKLTAALNKPVSPASIMIWCPELLSCHFSGRVIFVLRTKDNVFFFLSFCFFLRIVNSLFLLSCLPPLLLRQVEIKMKKTEAVRWEKLEGEGHESSVKHFNPSQSAASTFALFHPTSHHQTVLLCLSFSPFLFLPLSAKINISSCVCLFCTKMRVGSRALLRVFH